MHTRIEAEIADQFLRALEARKVADRRLQPGCHHQVDVGNGEQAPDGRIVQRGLGNLPVEDRQVFGQSIEFAHMPLGREPLIIRLGLARQPVPATPGDQIGVRTFGDQVRI